MQNLRPITIVRTLRRRTLISPALSIRIGTSPVPRQRLVLRICNRILGRVIPIFAVRTKVVRLYPGQMAFDLIHRWGDSKITGPAARRTTGG
jgi:hypothetical protein